MRELFDDYADLDDDGDDITPAWIAEYERAVAAETKRLKNRTPEQVAQDKERNRCRQIYKMILTQPKDMSEEGHFFTLISETPDQINQPIDGLGNTLAHYLANPKRIPYIRTNADKSKEWAWRSSTEGEEEALWGWAETILAAKPDPFIANAEGFTAVDLACEASPDSVELLLNNDGGVNQEGRKRKAKARAIFMAAAGMASEVETPSTEDVVGTIVGLGAYLDTDCEFLECGNAMRSCLTFREVLPTLGFSKETLGAVLLALMSQKERDARDVENTARLLFPNVPLGINAS